MFSFFWIYICIIYWSRSDGYTYSILPVALLPTYERSLYLAASLSEEDMSADWKEGFELIRKQMRALRLRLKQGRELERKGTYSFFLSE